MNKYCIEGAFCQQNSTTALAKLRFNLNYLEFFECISKQETKRRAMAGIV